MVFEGKILGFVPTRDAELARRFYEGVLGMRLVSDDQFALVMDAGGTTIRIVRVGEFTPAAYTILGWEVRGIAEVVARMTQAGVQMERYGFPGQGDDGIWNAPGGAKVAWFKDPDGNVLSVSEHGGGAAQVTGSELVETG